MNTSVHTLVASTDCKYTVMSTTVFFRAKLCALPLHCLCPWCWTGGWRKSLPVAFQQSYCSYCNSIHRSCSLFTIQRLCCWMSSSLNPLLWFRSVQYFWIWMLSFGNAFTQRFIILNKQQKDFTSVARFFGRWHRMLMKTIGLFYHFYLVDRMQ